MAQSSTHNKNSSFERSRRARFQKQKDTQRYRDFGGEALVIELIQRLGELDTATSEILSKMARQVAGDSGVTDRRAIGFLAKTILRQAIGCGYIRLAEDKVLLTRKSRPLLAFTREGEESPEHIPAGEVVVSPEELARQDELLEFARDVIPQQEDLAVSAI